MSISNTGVYLDNEKESKLKLIVRPVVLFSILDHFMRRKKDQKRVIGTFSKTKRRRVVSSSSTTIKKKTGTLLGKITDNVAEITNCYPVHHTETKKCAVDKEVQNKFYSLHRRTNKSEQILGWYATSDKGETVTPNSCLIHDYYRSPVKGVVVAKPIHLVVDTSLKNDSLSVKALMSSALTMMTKTLAACFTQVPVKIGVSNAERIAMSAMDETIKKQSTGVVNSNKSEIAKLNVAISELLSSLDKTCKYVDDVVDGKIPMRHDVGKVLSSAVSAIPQIDTQQVEKMFDDSVQDLLMVAYLSNLTRTQLAIAEKVNCLL